MGWKLMTSSTIKTLFDSSSVTVAETKKASTGDGTTPNLITVTQKYYDIFDLVTSYTFISASPRSITISHPLTPQGRPISHSHHNTRLPLATQALTSRRKTRASGGHRGI